MPLFRRIMGLETEYGLSLTGLAGLTGQVADAACERPDPSAESLAALLFRPVQRRYRAANTFLPNGSRIYLDVGAHPEYATAEAIRPRDLLVADLAGESLMKDLCHQAQAEVERSYGPQSIFHLFKNNVDSQGNAFGCHENYLIHRGLGLLLLKETLIPFLVTRQIFTGTGHMDQNGFQLSARADFLDEAVSSATTHSRPMINTRDETHADSRLYRRLHVITGESNRSQTATWMKAAITHLVLCLIEEAWEEDEEGEGKGDRRLDDLRRSFALADPAAAMREISHSLGQTPILLEDRRRLTAARIQGLYWDRICSMADRHQEEIERVEPAYRRLLDLWKETIDRFLSMEEDPGSQAWLKLVPWVDWAAKRLLLEKVAGRPVQDFPQGSRPGLLRLIQMDQAYHDLAQDLVYRSLLDRGVVRRQAQDDQVAFFRDHAPQSTRARMRAALIRLAQDHNLTWSCDWTHCTILSPLSSCPDLTVDLLDPFRDQDEAALETARSTVNGWAGQVEADSAADLFPML